MDISSHRERERACCGSQGMRATGKTHILHIVNSLQVGGMEQVVVNIINELDPSRYSHSICCIQSTGPMVDRISFPVRIYTIGKKAGPDYLIPFKIARIIRKIDPDVVHTRNWGAVDGVLGAILAGVKAVVHDEHGRDAADPDGINVKRRFIRKALSYRIRRFIPVSADLEKWLVDVVGIAPAKVQKIHNGVDTMLFHPADDRGEKREKLGMENDSFVIGFVGRLDPVKDLATLLRSFALFSSNLQRKTYLYVVGKGSELESLKKLCNELEISSKVFFAGECNDIPTVMRCIDIFTLTSIAEGIPMTVLEAMASGLPVVATDVGGLKEIVEPYGTGFLTPVRGVEEIAAAFTAYANDPELVSCHGKNARKKVERDFSIHSMVAQYDALYMSLFAGGRS